MIKKMNFIKPGTMAKIPFKLIFSMFVLIGFTSCNVTVNKILSVVKITYNILEAFFLDMSIQPDSTQV